MSEQEDQELLALINEGESKGDEKPQPPEPPTTTDPSPVLSLLKHLTGSDILCIFGATGSGKSKMVCELAVAEQRAGGKVVYFDTEQGFGGNVIEMMKRVGIDYRRMSDLRGIYQAIKTLTGTLVVIDSTTLGITGRWFAEALDSKGRLLQEVQYLYYMMKEWCHKHNAMAIVIAQPTSEFGGRGLEVMGDKANFYLKDTLFIDFVREEFTVKKRALRVFKSRSLPEGMTLCDLKTTATGMVFGPLSNEAKNIIEG